MPTKDYYLPSRRLVSQNDSAIIENARVPRSKFIGSWTRKTAFDAGGIFPILVEEVLPGDHLRYQVTAYIRMATPLFPILDNQRVDTFFFFVPARLLWAKWAQFMGEQASSPSDPVESLVIPTVTSAAGGFPVGSLADHMGVPTVGQIGAGNQIAINALPLRAYNLIWNTWFRDQNIQSAADFTTADTGDLPTWYVTRARNKSHDYFTSALPWPNKFTAPSIPLVGNAPIKGIGVTGSNNTAGTVNVYETDTGLAAYDFYASMTAATIAASPKIRMEGNSGTSKPLVYADLAAVSGVAINTLRQAFLVQELLERDARGGTRYVELLKSHFGVTNPDYRLQRPEYIGGGSTPLNITPIAQTAPSAEGSVGTLGGTGTAAGQHTASYAATEHGYILGLINIKSELSYQQGLHRMWTRSTRYDFYWPALAGLGEQAILRREIYMTGVNAEDLYVFGYQERWHEYRTRYSEVTGLMRSYVADTLDTWHLAQSFASAPLLNGTFLADNPPMTRVLAAGSLATNQQYLADIMFQRTAVRPIPTFGTPVRLGRF